MVVVCLFVFRFLFLFFQDFWQMTLHHIVTILLLGFSFYAGFFRIGAVIILVHDVADIFLEVILHIERGFSDY